MKLRQRLISLTAAVMVSALLGGIAFAGIAWQEQDWSDSINSDSGVLVCDGEDDGFNAVVDYYRLSGARHNVEDTNGAVSGCAPSPTVYSDKIKQHKTCERQVLRPDPCSGWSYE